VYTPLPLPTGVDPRPDLARYILVDQATQRMLVFVKGQLVRDMACSTGLPTPDTFTPAWSGRVGWYVGTFFSFDVYADDAWYLWGEGLGAYLIHSLPYTRDGTTKVYRDREALGVRPSSHGCIRIAPEDNAWLNAFNPEGAYLTITELPGGVPTATATPAAMTPTAVPKP
jgi:lipoprotein-anchoring transpeptidase ErfK/SrfK